MSLTQLLNRFGWTFDDKKMTKSSNYDGEKWAWNVKLRSFRKPTIQPEILKYASRNSSEPGQTRNTWAPKDKTTDKKDLVPVARETKAIRSTLVFSNLNAVSRIYYQSGVILSKKYELGNSLHFSKTRKEQILDLLLFTHYINEKTWIWILVRWFLRKKFDPWCEDSSPRSSDWSNTILTVWLTRLEQTTRGLSIVSSYFVIVCRIMVWSPAFISSDDLVFFMF